MNFLIFDIYELFVDFIFSKFLELRDRLLGQLRAAGFVRNSSKIGHKTGKDEFGSMKDVNLNSDKWSVIKAALLIGAFPNIGRINGKHVRVITANEDKAFMIDTQSICARAERQHNRFFELFF